jgi:hypothetical protein
MNGGAEGASNHLNSKHFFWKPALKASLDPKAYSDCWKPFLGPFIGSPRRRGWVRRFTAASNAAFAESRSAAIAFDEAGLGARGDLPLQRFTVTHAAHKLPG